MAGRCRNADIAQKIGHNKLDKLTTVSFNVLTDTDNCQMVNTSGYSEVEAATVSYNRLRVPDDRFHCMPEGCINTGTLFLTANADDGTVSAKFPAGYDATEFYAGLATYYVYIETAGTYIITTEIYDVNDTGTNSDGYNYTLEVTEPGFYPIIVDFSQTPDIVNGNGWQASEAGATIEITIAGDGAFSAGISSIYFYDTLTDFENNATVEIGCLTEITRDLTVDATDATCWGTGYDPESPSVEMTITGKSVTPNFYLLNALESRGERTDGWKIQGDSRTVEQTEINGITYGYIQIPDLQLDECGFISAQVADECNVTDSQLNRVSSPNAINIAENQFIVLDGSTTVATDAGKILFNEYLIGAKIIIRYPKKTAVESWVATDENLESRRVRMAFNIVQTDGVEMTYVYNNVLVTSFPFTINTDETEFEFSITVQRDSRGRFYEYMRTYS